MNRTLLCTFDTLLELLSSCCKLALKSVVLQLIIHLNGTMLCKQSLKVGDCELVTGADVSC